MVTLHTDGGARGNPGPAAIGGVARENGEELFSFARYIGETTNNQAEYQALLEGLRQLRERGVREVVCYLDSDLVVQQLAERYRVKNLELKPLFNEVQALAEEFSSIKFVHVRREGNAEADRLVNRALDER
jgi:ribonuclease HI